ncbi:MAG: beta-ketoacyl-ACP synthase 3 [Verrucomicrobia bacterium]|nr:beta-ketoacyl-ACP synthase 3 [Verrucomicrobiota bacterium]MCH8529050.1 beta-ketoacyl-ACP synthase 3 [Kiritimatiellia bacterium]
MKPLKMDRLRELFRVMLTARVLDEQEKELVTRGEAFFQVSGAGHEGSAALAGHLIPQDVLCCHYRDKALMLARGATPRMFLDSVLCRETGPSGGRQMSAHMSDRAHNILSIPGPVGNNALHAAGVAAAVRDRDERPIVLCSAGDGTTQQGEFLEAVAEAVRWRLPVLFLIHDNCWSISVSTGGNTFFSRPDGEASEFYGIPIQRVDGWDVPACDRMFAKAVGEMRETRRPALVVMRAERLSNHTNADDQRVYRNAAALEEAAVERDPLINLAKALIAAGIPEEDLTRDRERVRAEMREVTRAALSSPAPERCLEAVSPLSEGLTEYRGDSQKPELNMRRAINEVLRLRLEADPGVFLYGQDIEDPKGDVFGVTAGLSTRYPARVVNAPLSESTIVGTAIGRALAGQKPVAFLQFADFLPLAFNQIASELGSMAWRTRGEWECPVILMITCGGYRPGLGPFHAQTFESVAAHTPGVDVMTPATAADAAGMLNAAFQSGRPTLFFYPKNVLNDMETATSRDIEKHFVPVGRARVLREGGDLTLVGWGNTVALSLAAAGHLEKAGVECEVIDLRQIAPWDREAVLRSVRKTQRLLVAHEDNITCGFGAEVVATVVETLGPPVRARRVARADTYIPCNFSNQLDLLPSVNTLLEAAAELCDLELSWSVPDAAETDCCAVRAVGSSPADKTVEIITWKVEAGEAVETGQLLAEMEGDKAVLELTAPLAGRVVRLLAEEGARIPVGAPVLEIASAVNLSRSVQAERRNAVPHLHPRAPRRNERDTGSLSAEVYLGIPCVARGSRQVGNAELADGFADRSAEDIFSRTGIESRCRAAEGEEALSLAETAVRAALVRHHLTVSDLDLLICATGTPARTTPSMACELLSRLSTGDDQVQAFDVNAACSGFLYALQIGHDHLSVRGQGKVLIVTTEHLSPLLREDDFDTAILFGDAATATLLSTKPFSTPSVRLRRPFLSAQGDREHAITVPLGPGDGGIELKGRTVFAKAVRLMSEALREACAQAELRVEDLDLIVPHQANQRISDAVQKRLHVPADRCFSNIRLNGNTSSSSIPLALHELFEKGTDAEIIGLCAFGGGFTFGAAVLEVY